MMLESVQVGDTNGRSSGPTIVLCHGFGADAEDLAPLAREIPLVGKVRWLFPQAPYRFQMGWGAGRAWFPRDAAGLESFMSGEIFASLAEVDPPGLEEASRELTEFMDGMGCDPAQTVIGGFSQGAWPRTRRCGSPDFRRGCCCFPAA
jgi:predicted esterase